MRILLHDYSGHPFQVQLARGLADRGHDVLHVSCLSYRTGKGALAQTIADPPNFALHQIDLGAFERYAIMSRLTQEIAYGSAFARCSSAYSPDIILSCNDPLLAKARSAWWCKRTETPWVFWLQDLYSVAMGRYLSSLLGSPAALLTSGLHAIERKLLHEAAAVVAITDDFLPLLRDWNVPEEKSHVIENWAPLDEIQPGLKSNHWAQEKGIADRFVYLYAGTLGIKHDPDLLVTLAAHPAIRDRAAVVVVSEGKGADWLLKEASARALDNLIVLPYQPYQRLSHVFASADVLVALLEPDAGTYSVPSKILSYLCAGRPILAAMPTDNLGAQTIRRAGAGVVLTPDDTEGFLTTAVSMIDDRESVNTYGVAARRYAEARFDIGRIVNRFEEILEESICQYRRRRKSPSI